jgi:hypothetical protein
MWVVTIKAKWVRDNRQQGQDEHDYIQISKAVEAISDLRDAYRAAALAMTFTPESVDDLFGEAE